MRPVAAGLQALDYITAPLMGRGSIVQANNITKDNRIQEFDRPDDHIEEQVYVSPDELRAYDSIVRPNAIVPVSLYFIERWLPVLGVTRAWLALAFRQVAFVSSATTREVPVHTTLRRLGIWCGLSHVRIHQLLKDPFYLDWFVRNPSGVLGNHTSLRSEPSSYSVRSDIPLTPQDQLRLSMWLNNNAPDNDADWSIVLENSLAAKKVVLPKNASLSRQSFTIQQLVTAVRHSDTPLPPSIDKACNELHARWTLPDRSVLVTHYFLKKWLPDLSSGLGWLIILMRSRSYSEIRDTQIGQFWLRGGLVHISNSLNVSTKSVSRWVRSKYGGFFFRLIDSAHDPADKRCRLYSVNMSEPIHSTDQSYYEELLNIQNLSNSPQGNGQFLTTLTECTVQNLTRSGQKLTVSGQNLTSRQTKLNKQRTKFNNLSTFNYSFKDSFKDFQQQHVVPFDFWPINTILQQAGVKQKKIISVLSATEQKQYHFIAWLLFGVSISTIEFPVLFALKRMNESLPPEKFCLIAKNTPEKLLHWLIEPGIDVDTNIEVEIGKLRKANAGRLLVSWGVDLVGSKTNKKTEDLDIPKTGLELPPLCVFETAQVLSIWKRTSQQLKRDLDRTLYETWVRDLDCIAVEGNVFILATANQFARDWLNQNLKALITQEISKNAGREVSIRLMVL